MKTLIVKVIIIICLLNTASILVSCNGNKDSVVKADLATKAKEEKEFAGVRFTVESGVVTLSGECPTEKSKSTVEKTVKKVFGVKEVVNNITIASVLIGTDQALKESVDSVLKTYPAVQAITVDSIVALEGKVESSQLPKLLSALNSLRPRFIENKLVVQ